MRRAMTYRRRAMIGLLILIVSVTLLTVVFDNGEGGISLVPEAPLSASSIESYLPKMTNETRCYFGSSRS
jgi:hypothetical protein